MATKPVNLGPLLNIINVGWSTNLLAVLYVTADANPFQGGSVGNINGENFLMPSDLSIMNGTSNPNDTEGFVGFIGDLQVPPPPDGTVGDPKKFITALETGWRYNTKTTGTLVEAILAINLKKFDQDSFSVLMLIGGNTVSNTSFVLTGLVARSVKDIGYDASHSEGAVLGFTQFIHTVPASFTPFQNVRWTFNKNGAQSIALA